MPNYVLTSVPYARILKPVQLQGLQNDVKKGAATMNKLWTSAVMASQLNLSVGGISAPIRSRFLLP